MKRFPLAKARQVDLADIDDKPGRLPRGDAGRIGPDQLGGNVTHVLYIDWRRGASATMRQTHVAGEKLFVDYAGDTVPVFPRVMSHYPKRGIRTDGGV